MVVVAPGTCQRDGRYSLPPRHYPSPAHSRYSGSRQSEQTRRCRDQNGAGAGAGAGAGDGAGAVTSIMTGRSDVKMEFYNTLSTYLFEEIRTNFRLWILKKARLQLRITDWKKSIQN